VRTCTLLLSTIVSFGTSVQAQGLRQVPQRFAFVQPAGMLLGMGTAGFEVAMGRRTGLEVSGVGVYSKEDGIEIHGFGGGVGIRRYFGEGELAGLVIAARVDGIWLEGDNSRADRQFLSIGPFESRERSVYLGVGGTVGYRWVSRAGFYLEPLAGYEILAGPRPLVAGSQDLQNRLGWLGGMSIGFAW
jgi:hypothetical protein